MRLRSIRAKLAWLFTAAAFVTLGSLCVALYFELKRELASREYEDLTSKSELIRHLATEVRTDGDWASLTRLIDDIVVGDGKLRVWIVRSDSTVLYGGRQLPEVISTGAETLLIRREDGLVLRALATQIAANDVLPDSQLIVALDERTKLRTLAEFRLALAGVTVLGVLVAAGLGFAVARRGLSPVRSLAEQAATIEPGRLSQRLPVAELPEELRELGHSFNSMLERLQQAYQQMEAFNSDVAHELRSPLANLIGGTQLALSRERSSASYRETLESNLEELERLKIMVNDMLFLARADRGDRIDRNEEVELASEALRVVEYYESSLEEAGIRAQVNGMARVWADAGLIRRALSNLLSNAIRYTAGGDVIRISVERHANEVELSVENRGPVIDPAHLPHLFTRFFRGDAARTSIDHQHHGLGLAIVKAIARMHGGDAFATSAAGTTRIGLRLPFQAAPARSG